MNKLELLINGSWVETPNDFLKGLEQRYRSQGTPLHFDSDKYQYFVKPLEKTQTAYVIYRVERKMRDEIRTKTNL